MNSCEYYQELISRMLDDELSNRERSVLAEHLSVCTECAAMYSAFSLVSDAVATDLVEPPEELSEDVMAYIRRAEIRKRNRRNSRATRNAITAAACVALVVAAAGGFAVVRSHRSNNAVYESRMSQSASHGVSARDANVDAVVVSEQPVAEDSSAQNGQTKYEAPVENYVSSGQEEKTSFFANILPDSWLGGSSTTPAPTQAPVYTPVPYATPMATPYAQYVPTPAPTAYVDNSAQAPIVVVSPTVTAAPVVETPVVTAPPAAETPEIAAAPVAEAAAEPENAALEAPEVTAVPTAEPVYVTEAPVAEFTVPVESPVLDIPALPEMPMAETYTTADAPATSASTGEAGIGLPEIPTVDAEPIIDTQILAEAPIESALVPEESMVPEEVLPDADPVLANHDFSLQDCSELIEALFTSQSGEMAPAPENAGESSADGENVTVDTQYASYVDKLIAENGIEQEALPEDTQADRLETLSLAQDGMFFTIQVNIYGDQIYVFSYDSNGLPVSFASKLSVMEYDRLVQLCYEVNENW